MGQLLLFDVAHAFAPARDSINWAENAVAEFKDAASVFFQGDITEVITERDTDTGQNIQKLRFRKALPRELKRKATEALLNSRHAFDQAVFASQSMVVGPCRRSLYYPWASDPADLECLLKRRRIDKRLWDTFRAHEPYPRADTYPGGDNIIRALAKMANRKHSIGLAVKVHFSSVGLPDIVGGSVQELEIMWPTWDAVKNEAELIRWVGDVDTNGDYKFRFEIIFEETGLAQPVNVTASLSAFHSKAKEVVESLQARCFEICSQT